MGKRVVYLIEVYLLTVLIFIAAKVTFMFYYVKEQTYTAGDVFDVLRHGLSLDLSMGLYLISVPFLCIGVSIWYPHEKVFRYILRTFYVLIAMALALAFVADTSLYEFWQFKLDASCLQYLETPTEAMASVSVGYMIARLVAVIVLAVLFAWAYWHVPLRLPRVRRRIVSTVVWLLLVPLIVIGIRGGLSESTTNIGQVYYSQNQFLNHAAVNPVFSFFSSFEKTASNHVTYHFMDDAACQQIVSALYDTQSVDSDTLLTTQHPNIIVILLESCGSVFTEVGGRKDVMPHLNRLMHEGVYFANCYSNTWRTDRGTVCTWSGYPSFPTMSVMKIPSKSRSLPNIAKTLQDIRGYHTYYLYGGDINFTNMRSYLVSGGFNTLRSMEDFTADEQKSARWGVRDDITFKTLYDMASSASTPFLIGFSTLSSHQPWDVPVRQFDDEILNAFYYLDQCIGDFIHQLRQSALWQNTLVVMLPDHGFPFKGLTEADPLKNHIPMLWVGGAVKAPKRIEQVCNQTDLPATLLGQLGVNHEAYTFSRDVMSKTYTQPFAINTYDDGFSLYDSVSFVNYDLLSDRLMAERGQHTQLLLQRGRAILQAASKDLNER